jgi:hypothetical protein
MVSKLLLAAQESFFRAVDSGAPQPVLQKLAECYYDIRSGIGDYKSPVEYGAFPMDPYSHTPAHTGARQPGLTGQVKEDVLCRRGELGVFVKDGKIHFQPTLLRRDEFLKAPAEFNFYNVAGGAKQIRLPANSIGFTCCEVPVVYQIGAKNSLEVVLEDGSKLHQDSLCLSRAASVSIFERTGKVSRINVSLHPHYMRIQG